MRDPLPRPAEQPVEPLLLTPEQAATVLGVGRTTVYALMKAGDLRPVHIGRSCRLSRAELERYVAHLQGPPAAATRRPRRRARPDQVSLFDVRHGPDGPANAGDAR